MENVNMAFCLISEKKLYGLFSIKHFWCVTLLDTPTRLRNHREIYQGQII